MVTLPAAIFFFRFSTFVTSACGTLELILPMSMPPFATVNS